MKKKYHLISIFLALLLALPINAYASPSDKSSQSASKAQTREIISFGKKFGWNLDEISFLQKSSGLDSLSSKKNWESQIERSAQFMGLSGKSESYELVYGQLVELDSTSKLPYTLEFRFWFGKASGKMLCAYTAVIPYGNGGYEEDRALYRDLSSKRTDIQRDMKSYYERNLLKAEDDISAKDFPVAYKITNLAANRAFQDLFSQYGFYSSSMEFGYALPALSDSRKPEGSAKNFLSTRDLEKALFVATDGKGVGSKIDSSNLFFAERSYFVPNSKSKFYIGFCVANEKGSVLSYNELNSFKNGDKVYPDYCFLIVRPAKPQKDGSLDRFFYPASTSLQTISNDMQSYFKGIRPGTSASNAKNGRLYPL